jgi:hypothetical protein
MEEAALERIKAREAASVINNISNGGPSPGGIQASMSAKKDDGDEDDDPFEYRVKIRRRNVVKDGNLIGWDKHVHRYRHKKGEPEPEKKKVKSTEL